ncbi:MAG TPA: hypothetical protein VF791_16020 [Pyrinomonadaceae bacterium]
MGDTETTIKTVKLDKTTITVSSLFDESDEKAYWHSKTPEERLQALELMRQSAYGYDPATARLQRVLEVAERQTS